VFNRERQEQRRILEDTFTVIATAFVPGPFRNIYNYHCTEALYRGLLDESRGYAKASKSDLEGARRIVSGLTTRNSESSRTAKRLQLLATRKVAMMRKDQEQLDNFLGRR